MNSFTSNSMTKLYALRSEDRIHISNARVTFAMRVPSVEAARITSSCRKRQVRQAEDTEWHTILFLPSDPTTQGTFETGQLSSSGSVSAQVPGTRSRRRDNWTLQQVKWSWLKMNFLSQPAKPAPLWGGLVGQFNYIMKMWSICMAQPLRSLFFLFLFFQMIVKQWTGMVGGFFFVWPCS